MGSRRRTRGRRKPFNCGHRGFGAECNRCGQANQLETRANELAQALKNKAKTLPDFVELTPDSFTVRAGGVRVSAKTTGDNFYTDGAVTTAIVALREHATRLQKASNYH